MISKNNFFFNKIVLLLSVLSVLALFYIYSFIVLMSAEFLGRDFLNKYFVPLRVGVTVLFTGLFLFLFYDKKRNVLSVLKLLLILFVSFFLSGLLAYLSKNSPFWIVKYLIGIAIGTLFYFLYKEEVRNKKALLSGVVALFALLLCESLELFFIMDRPDFPSVLYIKSFPNPILWLVTIAFVFFSSYFFSKGFRLKKRLIT